MALRGIGLLAGVERARGVRSGVPSSSLRARPARAQLAELRPERCQPRECQIVAPSRGLRPRRTHGSSLSQRGNLERAPAQSRRGQSSKNGWYTSRGMDLNRRRCPEIKRRAAGRGSNWRECSRKSKERRERVRASDVARLGGHNPRNLWRKTPQSLGGGFALSCVTAHGNSLLRCDSASSERQ